MSQKQLYRVLRPISAYGEQHRKGALVSLTPEMVREVADRVEAVVVTGAAVEPAAAPAPEAPQAPSEAASQPEAPAPQAEAPSTPEAPQAPALAPADGQSQQQPTKEDLSDL